MLVLLLTLDDAFAAEKWTSVRSKNFTLVGNATEAQIRAAAFDLEQFRDAFAHVFPNAAKAATVPVNVVVFKSDDSYRPFKPLVAGQPAAVTGYFHINEDMDYIALTGGTPIPAAVYHQYAHELMRDMPVMLPLWFTEGAAEFFSAFEVVAKEKKYTVGQVIPGHVDQLKKNPLIPFDELFKFDRSSPQYNEVGRSGMYYAESWALVNYLIVGLNGKHQAEMTQFLDLLAKDKPALESFRAAFKTDYQAIQQELEYYVRDRKAWPTFEAAMKDKNEIDKETKVKTLSEAESEFYAGDLLLHMNRLIEAENHLKLALTLDPSLSAASAARGMVQFRLDQVPEALNALKHATDTDPKNYLALYYTASVLDKSSNSVLDDLDAKRAALGKAIELAPQYIPAYQLIAYLNLAADIDYDGTFELLQKARSYVPGNPNIRFLMAQVMVKQQKFDSAETVLQTLMTNSSLDTALRDSARTLMNFIARSRETENQPPRDAEEVPKPQPTVVEEAVKPTVKEEAPAAPTASSSTAKKGELELITPQKARPEGTRVTGVLTLVDCRNGLTLTVKAASQTVTLHTDTPAQVQFFSNVPTINTSIQCGPTPGGGLPVIVTYKPTPGGPSAGEPLFVEFVERF